MLYNNNNRVIISNVNIIKALNKQNKSTMPHNNITLYNI